MASVMKALARIRSIAQANELGGRAREVGTAGIQALREAPSIESILAGLQGGPTQEDIRLATEANFGALEPSIMDALSFARANAAQRGFLNDSTIGAALQGRALLPLLAQARAGTAQSLLQLPFQRASALSGLRGQAFGEALGGQNLEMQLRDMRFREKRAKKSRNPFKKILGAGLGALVGTFTGGLGTAALGGISGLFGGGGGDSSGSAFVYPASTQQNPFTPFQSA